MNYTIPKHALQRLQAKVRKLRLEYLRGELRAERISLDELNELMALVPYIEWDDVELLEAAGVPEFPNHKPTHKERPKPCPTSQLLNSPST